MNRVLRLAVGLCFPLALGACGARQDTARDRTPIAEVRRQAKDSQDAETLARWLLAESLTPGGSAEQAIRARKALGDMPGGMLPHLARGLHDSSHGRLKGAAEHYMRVVQAARDSRDPNAPLIAWFAANQVGLFRHGDKELFGRWKGFLESALNEPRALGWRARAELAELWQAEAWSQAAKDVVEAGVDLHGCA
ncbi:MAG TPA: hypothetical protein VIM73_18500, partial [Polyangiaceae bacterium]